MHAHSMPSVQWGVGLETLLLYPTAGGIDKVLGLRALPLGDSARATAPRPGSNRRHSISEGKLVAGSTFLQPIRTGACLLPHHRQQELPEQ